MNKIKIIIADDHPVFRKGLADVISSDNNFIIIDEAGDGESALKLIKENQPDIALLDLSMPKLNGFDVLKEINKSCIPTRIIFLTMHKEEDIFNRSVDLGVKGYILKESALEDIIECIGSVYEGSNYFSPQISSCLLNRNKFKTDIKDKIDKLSSMEKKILKLISDKKTSREISKELYISIRTVENHRANICHKLELHGINSLLKFAVENKHLI